MNTQMVKCPKCGTITFNGVYCFCCQYRDEKKFQEMMGKAEQERQKGTAKPQEQKKSAPKEVAASKTQSSQQNTISNGQQSNVQKGTSQKPTSTLSFDHLRSTSGVPGNRQVIKPPTNEELQKIRNNLSGSADTEQKMQNQSTAEKTEAVGITEKQGQSSKPVSEWSNPVSGWSDPADFDNKEAGTQEEKDEAETATPDITSAEDENVSEIFNAAQDDETFSHEGKDSHSGQDEIKEEGSFEEETLPEGENHPKETHQTDDRNNSETKNPSFDGQDDLQPGAVNTAEAGETVPDATLPGRDFKDNEEDKIFSSLRDDNTDTQEEILEQENTREEKNEPEPQKLNTGKGTSNKSEEKKENKTLDLLKKFGKKKETEEETNFDPSGLSENELLEKLSEDVAEKEGPGKGKIKENTAMTEVEQYEMDRADFVEPDESIYNPNYDNYYDDVPAEVLSYPDKITAGDVLKVVGVIAAVILFLVVMMFVI